MTEKQHEHFIHYELDGEPESTVAKKLTPAQILSDAGFDPNTNYLEQLVDHKIISYKDEPNIEIEMKNGLRFLTKPIGPMPVS